MIVTRIFMILAFLLAVTPSYAQVEINEASLRAADQEQRRLVFEGKPEALDKILHPNMLINGPNGRVVTREMFLESVRSGAISKESFERIPEAVRITGNIGVLVGHELIVAAPGSRDFATYGREPFKRRYTNVFMFENGKWFFIARQASITPNTPSK